MATYTGTSIVDYLKSIGQSSDYAARKTLAASKNITNYTGTAQQNTQLLNLLRSTPQTTTQPKPVTPTPTGGTPTGIIPTGTYTGTPSGAFNINTNQPSMGQPGGTRQTSSNPVEQLNFDANYIAQTKNSLELFKQLGGTGNNEREVINSLLQKFNPNAIGFMPSSNQVLAMLLQRGTLDTSGNIKQSLTQQGSGVYGGTPTGPQGGIQPTPGIQPGASQGPAQGQTVQFDPNTGQPLQPGQSVTFQGKTYTQGQPFPTGITTGTSTTVQGTNQPLGIQLGITKNLGPGASGAEVKKLQEYLISQGQSIPAGATGYYGPQTKAAVEAWQKQVGLDISKSPGGEADYGYFGPLSRQFMEGGSGPTPTNGGPTITESESGLDPLTPAEKEYSDYLSVKSYDEIYNELATTANLKGFEDQLKVFSDKLDAVRTNLIKKKEDINNNPWISESQRLRKVKSAEASVSAEEANAIESYKQVEKLYNDARQEVQFAAKMAVDQQNKDREFYYQAKQDALKAQMDLLKSKGTDTQVVSAGGRRLLINKQTGATIKDLGSAASTLNITGGGFTGTGATGISEEPPAVDTTGWDTNDWQWYMDQLILAGEL